MQSRQLLLAAITTVAVGASSASFASSQNLRQESQDYLAQTLANQDSGAQLDAGQLNGICIVSGNCGVSIFGG